MGESLRSCLLSSYVTNFGVWALAKFSVDISDSCYPHGKEWNVTNGKFNKLMRKVVEWIQHILNRAMCGFGKITSPKSLLHVSVKWFYKGEQSRGYFQKTMVRFRPSAVLCGHILSHLYDVDTYFPLKWTNSLLNCGNFFLSVIIN